MKKWNAQELWNRYRNDQATNEEQELVERWYNQIDGPAPSYEQQMKAMKAVSGKLPVKKNSAIIIKLWSGIAAAIILISVAGLYFFHPGNNSTRHKGSQYATRIKPGSNNAYLTLANGKKVILTNGAKAILATQSGLKVATTANGQLIYTVRPSGMAASNADTILAYNTLVTPKGGQYQVVLPDGTRVWLNAASSLTYPTIFKGTERSVALKGEGYFEVAKVVIGHHGKPDQMPFIVKTAKGTVSVLGTHFNINAYADEADEKTTLLEGSVKVTVGDAVVVIKPGEQTTYSGAKLTVSPADVEQVVAWKNGLFDFKKVGIQSMMRQVARWYDVDVAYEGKISEDIFVGKISRDANIIDVLRILSLSDVHYRIEGRKIIVKN